MTTINKQFEQYADIQKQAFEPIRAFGGIAAEAFELLARQNHAIFGDYVDFAVDQAHRAVNTTDLNDYFSQQIETFREFGEQMNERVQQYADITRQTGDKVKQAGPIAVPADKKAAKKAA